MTSQAVPLVGGFYADDARPWSSQDVCNWIPVLAEQPNTLSPAMYRTPPGLRPFVEVAGAGPVRGARNVEGRLLVVMGNELFQISNTGVAIPRGTIPGVGPVQISHNQQGNSNQVIIVNGSAGYIYDTATLDVTRITDAGYPGAKTVDYLASYFLQVEPSGLFWFHSDLADGFAYNTLDRYESEAKPDRLVAVKSSQLEAVAFNQTTIEFFTNTGAATGTFQSKGIVIETGCASANGIVELDNSLMWLDNKGVFQRMEGYGARPISTRVLERAIAGYDWSSAIAFVWEDKGHKVAYWTFRDGFTVGYDVTTGLWHRRASYGMDRWRLSCLANWNGKWIGGDFQTGKLYELDWDYPYDGQDPMVRRAVTGALHNDQRRMTVPSIELVFDTGGPSVEVADFPVQPEGPTITGNAPDGGVGIEWGPYSYSATGGTPPYSFALTSGSVLPAGIGPLSSSGEIAVGDPTTVETRTFDVRVTDANGLTDRLTDTIEIRLVDPYWDYVISLLHTQGDVGSNDYTDERAVLWEYPDEPTNPLNCSLSDDVAFLDAQTTSLEFTPIIGGTAPQIRSEAYGMGFWDGDFTVEFRVRFKDVAGIQTMWASWDASPLDLAIQCNAGVWRVYGIGTATTYISGGTIAADTDYAVAFVRSGTTIRLFINGVSLGTATFATMGAGADTFHVYGQDTVGSADADFYLGEARITKTICRYTANYTPALLPFPNEGP